VRPNLSYHSVSLQETNGCLVSEIRAINSGSLRINGGFFVFKSRIFDYIRPNEELVLEPFQRLIEEQQLIGYPYDGFWASMDTFKDKQHLESLYSNGAAPWEVWKTNSNQAPVRPPLNEVACVA
jgi:glucose-1-phosphate cytidylyltransferase